MSRGKRVWVRTKTASEITVYDFPFVAVWVAKQPRGHWTWRIRVGNEGVAMGDAPTQREAERAGIDSVKRMLTAIERQCR